MNNFNPFHKLDTLAIIASEILFTEEVSVSDKKKAIRDKIAALNVKLKELKFNKSQDDYEEKYNHDQREKFEQDITLIPKEISVLQQKLSMS